MTKKNINWRNDFNWMDEEDVQLDVLRQNTTIKEGELSPDNPEACHLMMALITEVKVANPKTIYFPDEDEVDEDRGVGKDIFGKYAYQEVEFGGKTFLLQIREKTQYDNAVNITQGRSIGPRVIINKKELN